VNYFNKKIFLLFGCISAGMYGDQPVLVIDGKIKMNNIELRLKQYENTWNNKINEYKKSPGSQLFGGAALLALLVSIKEAVTKPAQEGSDTFLLAIGGTALGCFAASIAFERTEQEAICAGFETFSDLNLEFILFAHETRMILEKRGLDYTQQGKKIIETVNEIEKKRNEKVNFCKKNNGK
jgi:hypothetical protein